MGKTKNEVQKFEDLNLVVTEDRLADVDLLTYYNLQKTSEAPLDFIAHFVVDDKGNYLSQEDAIIKVLTGRKVKDVEKLAEDLQASIEDTAVPK